MALHTDVRHYALMETVTTKKVAVVNLSFNVESKICSASFSGLKILVSINYAFH